MSISEISRKDTLKAVVTGCNAKGAYVSIIGLSEIDFTCRMLNTYLDRGTVVFATVEKIYPGEYAILSLDSIDYSSNSEFVA